jgi:hypothetical protein
LDSTRTDLIALRSPFNGEVVQFDPVALLPGQLDALLRAEFTYVNPPQGKPLKSKEKRNESAEV